MDYPQQSRNIAISNGSECGFGQGFLPGATLLNVVGKANTRFLTDLLGIIAMPLAGSIITQPAFLLGIVPGRNDFNFNFRCEAQPEGTTIQIYHGNITYSKRILWLINVNTTLANRSAISDPSVLPIDGTPGGMIDTEINLQSSSINNWAIKYNLIAYSIPHFNFIPTVSGLDIGGGNATLTMTEYRSGYVGANPPAAPFNSRFANFTTAFHQVPISNGIINNNENHIEIAARNGNFVVEELNGNINVRTDCNLFCGTTQIAGNGLVCNAQIFNVPLIVGATYTWFPLNSPFAFFNVNNNQLTITRNGNARGSLTINVLITTNCGSDLILSRNIEVGSNMGPVDFGGMPNPLCQGNFFNVYANSAQYNSYTWSVIGGYVMSGQGAYEAHVFVDNLIPPATSGYYEVSLQATDGCGEQLPLVVKSATVNDCSGGGIESRANNQSNSNTEEKIKLPIQLRAYPNPANSYFVLQIPNKFSGGTLKLMTQLGQVLKKEIIGTNLMTIDVQKLTSGVYFVQILTKYGETEYKKIVVVH